VLGLLLPFKADINMHYFIGNNFFQAGNMGRIDGEHWMDSVARGAESLVGTYMYAYGLIGVLVYITIHYKTIKILNKKKISIVAAILTVGLFVSFLQEGQYNVLQVFSMYLLAFFLIGRKKLKEKIYDT
jgi:NAD/NADP transhydrogenase beta subunit